MGLGSLFKGKKNSLTGLQKDTRDAYASFGNGGLGGMFDNAETLVSRTLGGHFLNGSPQRNEAIAASILPAQEAFQTSIAPSIAARASAYGRSGSPAEAAAFGDATQAFGRGLAETSARIGYEDYGRERDAQINAVMQALGIAGFEQQDQLARAGALGQAANIHQLGKGRSGGLFKSLAPIAGAAAGSFLGPLGSAAGGHVAGRLFGGGQ